MKIIDILNKKANGTLEDGFKFEYYGAIYTFNKKYNDIKNEEEDDIGSYYKIENILNDEVEVIEENKEIEKIDSNKIFDKTMDGVLEWGNEMESKINELVQEHNELKQAVNKLTKEREEK